MKISYRTHPALKFLQDGLVEMQVFQDDKYHFELRCNSYEKVAECFNENVSAFRKKVQYITEPFYDAITLSLKKMLSDELIENLANGDSGVFIYKKYVTCYNLKDANETTIFIFYENKMIFLLRGSNIESRRISFFSETNYSIDHGPYYEYEKTIGIVTMSLIATINFIKYATVETKQLAAGQKLKGIDCNYKNDTKSNVTILNSTWFTNLVKSDGFNVRGHFRLQPKKKDGEWTKELIWINDFEKHGYTRKAGILTNPAV